MSIGLMPTCSVQGNGSTARRTSQNAGGTRPRLEFRDIDYQLVIKISVETLPKNVGVSTLSLKRHLIISGLQISPWPRPASSALSPQEICP